MAERGSVRTSSASSSRRAPAALLRTAYLLAGDWATAEDLLQTALTKTYLAWRRLGEIEAVEPYARRVLVNTSTSWWRRRWHGERPTEVLPEPAGAGPDRASSLERDALWRHVRALPARQRAVLVLRFYEDLSEAETARLLGVSVGTVKSQASRALATLRRRLGRGRRCDSPPSRPTTTRRLPPCRPRSSGRASGSTRDPAPGTVGRSRCRSTCGRCRPRPGQPAPPGGRAAGRCGARVPGEGRVRPGATRPVGAGARPIPTTPLAAETR